MDFINLYLIVATVYLLCVAIAVTIHKMSNSTITFSNLGGFNDLSIGTLSAAIAGVACFLITIFTWLFPTEIVTNQPEYMVTSYEIFRILVIALTFIVLISIKPFILRETSFLVLLSIAGILLMATSTTLIGFYLALELISLSSYILASTSINNSKNSESYDEYSSVKSKVTIVGGLKYFLLSALSSGLLVLGISLIYYTTGELDFSSLARITEITMNGEQTGVEIYIGIYLMVTFVLFKLGSAPFHYWVADVYEKVNVLVNYYLIAVAKIGMIFALLKLTFAFPLMSHFLIICSVASIVIGSFAGLVQSKLRRLIAYSSINHVGYIILALSLSGIVQLGDSLNSAYVSTGVNITTISSLWLYVFIYYISTVTLFTIFLVVIENGSTTATNINSRINPNLTELATFVAFKNNIYISASFTITLLSLAGVPPLGGFMAKIAIFWQVLDTGNWFLATAAVLCSIIAAVYYLRVIKCIYFNSPYTHEISNVVPKMSFITALIISITSLTLVAYPILDPSFLYLAFN